MGASVAGWHAIESAFRCEQEWVFRQRGVHALVKGDPSAMHIGILVHAGRAEWFLRGFKSFPLAPVFEKAAHEDKLTLTDAVKENATVLVDAYLNHWSKRPLPKPVAVEKTFSARLFDAAGKLGIFGKRTARLDDVSVYPEAMNRLCLGELKTTSGTVAQLVEEYELHGQLGMQHAVFKKSLEGAVKLGEPWGHMLDVVIKKWAKGGGRIVGAECQRVPMPMPDWYANYFAENLRRLCSMLAVQDIQAPAIRRLTSCSRPRRDEYGVHHYACEYRKLCRHGKTAGGEYVMGAKSLHNAPPWAWS